jgi:lipid-A-disaccharide synthase
MRIGLVAGEASGDLLGGLLIEALKARFPTVQFVGIGGPKMESAGMTSWFDMERLSVHGYLDALKRYRELSAMRRTLLKRLLEHRLDAFIGVDAPDFNLWLEKRMKAARVPAIHYVSPSIWAWRGSRIQRIGQSVNEVLALFPFEPAIYQKAGIPVTYVGHPLADYIPMEDCKLEARARLNIAADKLVFALLPGSRESEVRHLAPTYIDTAKRLLERFPEARFLLPFANRASRDIFEEALWKAEGRELPMSLMFGHSHEAIAASDVVLVASGTATLEAALYKRPMVITYRISKWAYPLMKRMAYLPYVGLPNILAGRFVVPEFIQHEATPENLSQAMANWVVDKPGQEKLAAFYRGLHRELAQNNAERAANAIAAHLRSERQWQAQSVPA